MGESPSGPVTGEPYVQLSWPIDTTALVTINRPERLNALTNDVIDALIGTLQMAAGRPHCRAVVLTGAGRGFCAGMDIAAGVERDATAVRGPAVRLQGQETFAGMIRAIRALPTPVIAAVNGAAAGAGMGLALAADIRVASASAVFHVAAVKIGLSAGECGISYHLPRHIGTSKAFEHMLTGRPISAAEAEHLGLVSRVVPDGEVVGAALGIATEIAANSPFAVAQTKKIMWANAENTFDHALQLENQTQIMATLTRDAREAMLAFVEKRPPAFTGE